MRKIDLQIADIKTWTKRVLSTKPIIGGMNLGDLQKWLISQLALEVGPLMEANARAVREELNEGRAEIQEIKIVLDEMLEHEESYLQLELSNDIKANMNLGLDLCQQVVKFDPNDELAQKKLIAAINEYQQTATALLEVVEEITEEEDEDDDISEQSEPDLGIDTRGTGSDESENLGGEPDAD